MPGVSQGGPYARKTVPVPVPGHRELMALSGMRPLSGMGLRSHPLADVTTDHQGRHTAGQGGGGTQPFHHDGQQESTARLQATQKPTPEARSSALNSSGG